MKTLDRYRILLLLLHYSFRPVMGLRQNTIYERNKADLLDYPPPPTTKRAETLPKKGVLYIVMLLANRLLWVLDYKTIHSSHECSQKSSYSADSITSILTMG